MKWHLRLLVPLLLSLLTWKSLTTFYTYTTRRVAEVVLRQLTVIDLKSPKPTQHYAQELTWYTDSYTRDRVIFHLSTCKQTVFVRITHSLSLSLSLSRPDVTFSSLDNNLTGRIFHLYFSPCMISLVDLYCSTVRGLPYLGTWPSYSRVCRATVRHGMSTGMNRYNRVYSGIISNK